jgi:hypothetical protein
MQIINKIGIGKYTLECFQGLDGEDKIWLNTGDGEGMETSIKELEECLEKFSEGSILVRPTYCREIAEKELEVCLGKFYKEKF